MKVSLFIPCFIDALYPQVGVSMVTVLERLGCEVDVPPGQTCCGQPAFNSGYWNEARAVAEHALDVFSRCDVVVTASGSCGAMLKVFNQQLFQGHKREFHARELSSRVHEFSEFVVNVLGVTDVGARYPHTVTYHDGCHSLRELGIKQEPRSLLAQVRDLTLVEMTEAENCCGFGGTFSVKYPAISTAMAEVKCASIQETRAVAVVSADSSCLMQIQGLFHRQGQEIRCLHLAEILAHQ